MPSDDHPVGGLGIFLGKEWARVLHSESGSVSENAPKNATLDIGISSWDLPVFRGRVSQLSSACQQAFPHGPAKPTLLTMLLSDLRWERKLM